MTTTQLKTVDYEYFHQILLHKYVKDGQIVGFIGTSSENIEMLLIDPEFRGKGVGPVLTNFAILGLKIEKLNVNEQNRQSLEFYKKLEF